MGKKQNGFTIVEVALVLGIAGLIFLMVFAVLPSVWANERDSERRDDVLTFINKLKNFQTNNNRGSLPTGIGKFDINSSANSGDWADFYKGFLGESFKDPRGNNYTLIVASCSSTSSSCGTNVSTDNAIYVSIGATCDGSTAVGSANKRKVAAQVKLERADGVFCANS